MKIGYIMQDGVPDVRRSDPSGPANHVRQVIKELGRLGHHVRLLARLDGRIWVSDDLTRYRPVVVAHTDEGPRRLAERALRRVQWQFDLPYFSFFDSRRFAAACVQELGDSDLLFERMGWMGLGGGLAARRLRVPHVLEVNGDLISELELLGFASGPFQRTISHALMGKMARRVTHAVATGHGWRRRHIQCWRVDPRRVSVVQNGTQVVDFLERDQLRAFSGSEGAADPLRVAFVGSFDPWQGLPLLLAAVAKAVVGGANLQLTLAGSGREEARVKELTGALGLSDRVFHAGHLPVERLASCLSNHDVGVCLYSGRVEFTGLKILDYKAAGLATIATGQDGQPASVEHGVTGLIIPPDDEESLTSALCDLCENRQRTREMGRVARVQAETRHRWSHTALALESVFEAVCVSQHQATSLTPARC